MQTLTNDNATGLGTKLLRNKQNQAVSGTKLKPSARA